MPLQYIIIYILNIVEAIDQYLLFLHVLAFSGYGLLPKSNQISAITKQVHRCLLWTRTTITLKIYI